MNVLQIIRTLDPAYGGTVEALRQSGAAIAAAGHRVESASIDAPGEDFLSAYPFEIHALGPGIGRYGYSSRLHGWLQRNAARYDCVLVHGIWAYHSLATWRVLRTMSVPYLVFAHGMLDPWFKRRYPLKHLKKWLYWPWAEHRVLQDASAVLFTCEEERILARQSFWLYRCKEAVVGLGIPSPDGNSVEQRGAFFRRFPHLRGRRLALFLSRLHPKKGCDLLVQAFASVFRQQKDWQLVVAGPDQVGWKAELHSRAAKLGVADQITWAGMLLGPEKWGAYRAAEVFVLPSHAENFGIVVAEALACSLPVLISDKVNIWREIAMDGAGIVAPDTLPGTINLFQRWLGMLPGAQEEMRQRTKLCFEARFEVTRAATMLVDTLRAAVAHEHLPGMQPYGASQAFP